MTKVVKTNEHLPEDFEGQKLNDRELELWIQMYFEAVRAGNSGPDSSLYADGFIIRLRCRKKNSNNPYRQKE